jgi:hypothetical protein
MKPRAPRPWVHLVAIAAGAPPAFFLVFAGVFTDAGPPGERVLSLILVTIAYAVLGGLFAYVWPRGGGKWAYALTAPAVAVLVWYTTREAGQAGLHLAYLITAGLAAWLGAEAVARLRDRRRTVLP